MTESKIPLNIDLAQILGETKQIDPKIELSVNVFIVVVNLSSADKSL